MKVLVFPVLLAIAIITGPPQSAVSKTTAPAPLAAVKPLPTTPQPCQQRMTKKDLTQSKPVATEEEALTARR